MKAVLFCEHAYAFGILEPIRDVLKEKGYPYIWFTTKKLTPAFPYTDEPHTDSMPALRRFRPDALFIPGNYSPFYIRGYKVQVFHGLAGEKASHFMVRGYFDLYLTQGPYFTERFLELKRKHRNFDVIQTGWSKLDIYEKNKSAYLTERKRLLEKYHANKIVLLAPTHNASMNCALPLIGEFERFAQNRSFLTVVKFHDLTKPEVVARYRELAARTPNLILSDDPSISQLLYIADIMVSDTSPRYQSPVGPQTGWRAASAADRPNR